MFLFPKAGETSNQESPTHRSNVDDLTKPTPKRSSLTSISVTNSLLRYTPLKKTFSSFDLQQHVIKQDELQFTKLLSQHVAQNEKNQTLTLQETLEQLQFNLQQVMQESYYINLMTKLFIAHKREEESRQNEEIEQKIRELKQNFVEFRSVVKKHGRHATETVSKEVEYVQKWEDLHQECNNQYTTVGTLFNDELKFEENRWVLVKKGIDLPPVDTSSIKEKVKYNQTIEDALRTQIYQTSIVEKFLTATLSDDDLWEAEKKRRIAKWRYEDLKYSMNYHLWRKIESAKQKAFEELSKATDFHIFTIVNLLEGNNRSLRGCLFSECEASLNYFVKLFEKIDVENLQKQIIQLKQQLSSKEVDTKSEELLTQIESTLSPLTPFLKMRPIDENQCKADSEFESRVLRTEKHIEIVLQLQPYLLLTSAYLDIFVTIHNAQIIIHKTHKSGPQNSRISRARISSFSRLMPNSKFIESYSFNQKLVNTSSFEEICFVNAINCLLKAVTQASEKCVEMSQIFCIQQNNAQTQLFNAFLETLTGMKVVLSELCKRLPKQSIEDLEKAKRYALPITKL